MQDPQFEARNAIIRLADNELGSVPAPCVVPRVKGRPAPSLRTGPNVGEHNAQVYGELGFSETQLAELRQAGVI